MKNKEDRIGIRHTVTCKIYFDGLRHHDANRTSWWCFFVWSELRFYDAVDIIVEVSSFDNYFLAEFTGLDSFLFYEAI